MTSETKVRAVFYSGHALSDRVIKAATHGEVNHVGLYFRHPAPVHDAYVEAQGEGVLLFEGAAALARLDASVRTVDVAVPDPDVCERFLLRQCGKTYGHLALVACWFATFVPEQWGLVFYRPGTWICSALVSAALEEGGLYVPSDPRLMSPQNVLDWLTRGTVPMLVPEPA